MVKPLSLALRKVVREASWSIPLYAILLIGLTAWIIIPSTSSDLSNAFQSYGNNVGTYIAVEEKGTNSTLNHLCSEIIKKYHFTSFYCAQRLPEYIVQRILKINGTSAIYPLVENNTGVVQYNLTLHGVFPNGTQNTIIAKRFSVDHGSALIGSSGYPSNLIDIIAGRLPKPGEAAFVYFGNSFLGFGDAAKVQLNKTYQFEIPSAYINGTPIGKQFNATLVGIAAENPILADIGILWDSTFMQNELGNIYNSTFGGSGASYVIIKASNMTEVQSIVNQLQTILSSYSDYVPVYDAAFIQTFQSFVSQTQPLYELLSLLSLALMIAASLVVVYISAGRRRWEGALLILNGWSWSRIRISLFIYFLIISILAYISSIIASYLIAAHISFTYHVYGEDIVARVSPDIIYMLSGLIIAVAIGAIASILVTYRFRSSRIDDSLRSY